MAFMELFNLEAPYCSRFNVDINYCLQNNVFAN